MTIRSGCATCWSRRKGSARPSAAATAWAAGGSRRGSRSGAVRVRSVRVRGAAAVAALEGGEQVRLLRVGDRWRIVTPG